MNKNKNQNPDTPNFITHKKHNADTQNLLVALFLSMLIFGCWQYFVEMPRQKQEALNQKLHEQSEQLKQADETNAVPKTREELLAESPRVAIKSDRLNGSIALKGLHFDDLTLVKYQETLDPQSPPVILFSPGQGADGYFAEIGWLADDKTVSIMPNKDSIWTADSSELTPTHPVTLTWGNGGLTFIVKIALDDKYMFTINTSVMDVTNAGVRDSAGNLISFRNYAFINRVYDANHQSINISHEGPLGVFDGILHETTYKKLGEKKEEAYEANAGWFGIGDKYWLAAFVPPHEAFSSKFSFYQSNGRDHFQTEYLGPPQGSTEFHLFAGAKEMSILDDYESQYGIALFDHAVDLGWFDFLTKPILQTLTFFYKLTGNFGIAILILTVIVKGFMYPLASKQFRSMNQMKRVQPKIAEMKARYKDDNLKFQQEMMELYKREKINPASGCLPMFVQIPVFFSLYKVLYVTLEMRHAPFFGWIHDLSAPDPTNLFTLFGLIHWTPPTVMHLGVWPIIMSITMLVQQSQSPPPPDPAQAKMMKFLPIMFLFLFSNFAAGLVIYWCWSNTLSIAQQAYIKYKHGDKK